MVRFLTLLFIYFVLFISFALTMRAFASNNVHCPRADQISQFTAEKNGIYGSADGFSTPWIGHTADEQPHSHFKFEKVVFKGSDVSHASFRACYYTSQGVRLKMQLLDGSFVEAFLNIPKNSKHFSQSGEQWICTANELTCNFTFGHTSFK